jgi:Phytanoyl-CoA dioxygenase (PhyH)
MTQPAQELAAEGVAVVRGFLTPDDAADLRRAVGEIYAVMDSRDSFPDRRLGENFRVWDGVWLNAVPAFLRRERPDLAARYEQSLRHVEAQVKRVLGPDWKYFAKRSYFRRHRGMGKKVAWHIDADGATIFRIAASVINIWLPLDAVGRDLPSLEIVPRSHAAMRDIAMLAGDNRSRDDAFVQDIGDAVIPQMQLGDALIFDQFVLHRTQNVGAADAVRTACEFRFVRRSRPTLHGFSGWLRYKCNVLISAPGLVATRARKLLGHRRPDNAVQ